MSEEKFTQAGGGVGKEATAARAELIQRIVDTIVNDTARMIGCDDHRPEIQKLGDVAFCLGQITRAIETRRMLIREGLPYSCEYYLYRLGAYCLGWAEGKNRFNPLRADVVIERQRMTTMVEKKVARFAMWSPNVSAREKFSVLFRRTGRVAIELEKLETSKVSHHFKLTDFKFDLIQVTATCLAWIEGMEKQ